MDNAGRTNVVELARRFRPAEVARLVRLLESTQDGRSTVQPAAEEGKQ
jgi:hypothetical protein